MSRRAGMPHPLASYLAGLRPRTGTAVPDVEPAAAVTVDRDHLTRYARVCGFPDTDTLPATYPNVLAFPLVLGLMARRDFPFPLPGLVHVADEIVRYRPVDAGEPLDLRVRADRLAAHRRGRTVDVVVTASVAGEPVWSERATYLRRERGADAAGTTGSVPAGAEPGTPAGSGVPEPDGPDGDGWDEPVEPTVRWAVPRGVGRRYAAVSGDRNPIHLSAVTARPFGYRGAIAHGMWTAARCLAELEHRLPPAYAFGIRFRRPLRVPSRPGFGARPAGTRGYRFAVTGRGGRVLAVGSVGAVRQ